MGRPLVADPYPLYEELRQEDPVHREENGVWYLTRYSDCERVMKSTAFGHNTERDPATGGRGGEGENLSSSLVSLMFSHDDPPEHTRKRGRLAAVFSPGSIDAYAHRVDELVDVLVEEIADETDVDLDARLSARLPVLVTCEFLGIPHPDQQQCAAWVEAITSSNQPVVPLELRARADEAAEAAYAYFADLLKLREMRPHQDMISLLAQGGSDPDAVREAVATLVLLMAAGFETTRYTITGGISELARRRDQWSRAQAQVAEDGKISGDAVEELLRHQGPIHGAIPRVSRRPEGFGDIVIPAGEPVVAMVAAANRDPDVFDAPDRVDIDRKGRRPLSFGAGIHYCIGASLAKHEIRDAVSAVVKRFPRLEVKEVAAPKGSFNVRGPSRLLVSLTGA
jgi:cytochrome P450